MISYGVIPLQEVDGAWKTFIVYRTKGFWEFPKGHPEKGETEKQAAKRELKEETGFSVVKFLSENSYSMSYQYTDHGEVVNKKGVYFPAIVEGEVALQEDEVSEGKWVSFNEALELLSYKNSVDLFSKFLEDFRNMNEKGSI